MDKPASTLVRRVAPVAASAAGAFTLSHLLQQLSGHALWVPIQLRVAVEVFTTLLGMAVFLLVSSRTRRRPRKGSRTGSAQPQPSRRDLAKSICWTGGAIAFFVVYMWLRAACVIPWDSTEWVKTNPKPHPDFVDAEQSLIYIPLAFPAQDKAYIDQIGRTNPERIDGLEWIVVHEPDHLFDWLASSCRMRLWTTSTLFLLVHMLIISCVAVAAAYVGARWHE